MNISDEAVEAAVKAYINTGRPVGLAEIEAILKAAAPHMLADAWDEGYVTHMEDVHTFQTPNPYRSRP